MELSGDSHENSAFVELLVPLRVRGILDRLQKMNVIVSLSLSRERASHTEKYSWPTSLAGEFGKVVV